MEYLIDKSKAELIVLVKKLQLEIEHQKSADLFKRLFDAIPDAVFITRIGGENPGRILDVNIAAERQTGYDRKELLAMNILNDLATGVIMEATLKEREGELENRESIRFTEKKRRKDGSEYWTDVLTIMINFNNVNAALSVNRDITDRKQVEATLERERKLTQQYLDVAGIMLIALNKEQEVTLINPKGCEILNYHKEEILGQNWFDKFVQDENIEEVKRVFNQIVSGKIKAMEYYENPIVRKDGSKRIIAWHNSILHDSSEEIIGLFSSGEDITERKQIEKKLHKEMNFNQTLLQASPAFYVAISAEGKTIMVNETMLYAIGYKQEEVVGKDYMTTLVPERNREELSMIFNNLVQLNRPSLNENYILTKDGKELLVEWHGRPVFNEKGEFDYFFGLGIDITERKQAEEELEKHRKHLEEMVNERTAELEEKNEKLEYFNKLFIGREFRIKELRDRVKELEEKISDI